MLRHTGRLALPALALILLSMAGCTGPPLAAGGAADAPTGAAVAGAPAAMPVAFVSGRPVHWADLQPALAEAAGGQVLAERVLDAQTQRRLEDRDLALTPAQIEAEAAHFLRSLDTDADQAQRLLQEVRAARGLGETRWRAFLRRNAGLRLLVQDQVVVPESAIRQEYERRHGPRYQVRVITMDALSGISRAARRAAEGESFTDLAVELSTDESRAQGGLLSPISPADPSWPTALRGVLPTLAAGQVSDPIALDGGYALVKLERKIAPQPVEFDEARASLEPAARRQVESLLMGQLARTLLGQAEVVVLDGALNRSWQQHQQRLAPASGGATGR